MEAKKAPIFWDNLIARPSPKTEGKYEIAYGHHRLEAFDIPVKELDDYIMLKIMADENAEEYSMTPSVLNETVLSVKSFLDVEEGEGNRYIYGGKSTYLLSVGKRNWKVSWSSQALARSLQEVAGGMDASKLFS